MRILIVEDDAEMAGALTATLSAHGILTDVAGTISDAEYVLTLNAHDALLLDRQLPDGDGASLVAKLRTKGVSLPIILVTARGDPTERVAGLDLGADDYLPKPFCLDELVARLRAVMRRPSSMSPPSIEAGRLSFDLSERTVKVSGRPLVLPRRELLVLESLLRRLGRVVARSALEEAVYSFDDQVHAGALDTHVSRLRRKLLDSEAGVEIHGIRGIGYLMKQS